MRSPIRLVALTAGLAVAAALIPENALAQRGRGGGGGSRGGAVARAPSGGGARPMGARPSGGGRSMAARPPSGARSGASYRAPSGSYRSPAYAGRSYASGATGTRYATANGRYAVPRHPGGRYYGKGYYHGGKYYGHHYRPYYYPYYRSYYYPYYAYPYWGFAYGYPYYWGAYYGYPYWGYPSFNFGFYYGGGGGGGYDESESQGAARLEVKPQETEVFVDGYFAGVVDDFNGFKRLRLEPGEHEVTLYLEGHRPLTRKMLFTPGQTFRLTHTMEPLAAGEPAPQRPVPSARPAPSPQQSTPPQEYGRSNGSRQMMRVSEDRALQPASAERGTAIEIGAPVETSPNSEGTLTVRVQPGDAEIFIDGEPWVRASGERFVVSLPAGVHRLEVRKAGHDTYSGLVRIRAGVATTLNVALAPPGDGR